MKILGIADHPNNGQTNFILEATMEEIAGLAALDYEQRKRLRTGQTIDVTKLVKAVNAVKCVGTSLDYHIEHTEAAFRTARDGVKAIKEFSIGEPEEKR